MNAPSEYKFMIKETINTNDIFCFVYKIWYYWADKIDAIYNSKAIPTTGFYTFDGVDVWILNQHKQGFIYIYFKSLEEYQKLVHIIKAKDNVLKPINNPVYRYDTRNGWQLWEQYNTREDADIFGYDSYLEQIQKDIQNHVTYNSFLHKLGETRSINYVLYGPPGTGKTSLIRTIASKLDCAVFIVNAGNVTTNNISQVLSPSIKQSTTCPVKLLLFEDFDRFLDNDKVTTIMSQILNSLDGFDDKGNTVRFFTANNVNKILSVDALINRMSAKYEFHYPDRNIFEKKLERFLSFHESYDKEKAKEFVDLVIEKNITVRPFVNYVIRYLFDENHLENMIAHIDEL
jgi:predicted AAA+ superfamily ATPase